MEISAVHQECLQAFWSGQFEEAAQRARQGLVVAPDDGVLWQILGTTLWQQGDTAAALPALETATTLTPLEPLARLALGQCYLRAGLFDLARTTLVYLAETDRCPVMLMPRLAASLGELGAYTVALDVCFTLTDHRPDYHPAWFGIAYYLAKLGDPLADRLRYLRRAHELAPAAVTYRVALAAVLAELGSLTEAVDVIASVPASMVHCPCCLRKMATIFQQAGDRHAAAACEDRLRQAAAVSPSAHRD